MFDIVLGQESTAHTLAWAVYHISQHPDIEQRVIQEAQEVLNGRETPDYSDLGKLTYIDCVIKETLRLHPPVAALTRASNDDFELGGYHIKKGTYISVNLCAIHVDENLWTDPMIFNPDRFSEENSRSRHPFAFTPFAARERICIGMCVFISRFLPNAFQG